MSFPANRKLGVVLICISVLAIILMLFTGAWVAHSRITLLLDNHGGYSHAGSRIALHADGTCADTNYTDVVGDEKKETGRYNLNAEETELILSPADGKAEPLYRVDYHGQQYWVRETERERIVRSGEDWLRQTSLRVSQ